MRSLHGCLRVVQGAGRLPAEAHAQLGVGMGEVGLHRMLADVEPSADRLGGQALDRQGDDLVLPVGQ